MKTALYLLGFIGLSLAALFGIALWILGGAPSLKFTPSKTPPPDGFNAANFPPISTLEGTDKTDVFNLGAFGEVSDNYYLSDHNVAYFRQYSEAEGSRYIFINAAAEVIGTIEDYGNWPFPMGNVFVGFDGYHTVTADGVAPFAPYEVLGDDLTIEALKTLQSQSTLYRTFSRSDAYGRPEHEARLTTHVMLLDGVWKKAVTPLSDYVDWKSGPFAELDAQYEHAETDRARPWLKTFYGGKYKLRLTHFDQQDYVRKRGAMMGSTTGVGTPEHWRGTGYYTLDAGTAQLRFSIPNDIQVLSGGGRILLTLEGNEALDFVYLNYRGYGGAKQSFIISTPD